MERVISIVDYHQRKNNNHVFFDKQVEETQHCQSPWRNLIINQYGESYICASPAWLPKSIGNILDYDTVFDLLNSYEAQSIRAEILNNRYSYCNSNICGAFFSKLDRSKFNNNPSNNQVDLLDHNYFTDATRVDMLPVEIVLDFDYTCNFVCPTCRTELINNNKGPMAEVNDRIVEKIKRIIDLVNSPITLRWAGGEPFISRAYTELWEYIIKKKNPFVTSFIQTNGSYLKKKSELLTEFLPYIRLLRISFDAATPETYSKIRVNGNWETLMENCKWVSDLIKEQNTKTKLKSDYVVQFDNFKELPKYVRICKTLGFDEINIGKMWNWGTWTTEEFNKRNVSDPAHPGYQLFLDVLRDPVILNDPLVNKNYWINDL